jgi:predicted Zn-dependent protease
MAATLVPSQPQSQPQTESNITSERADYAVGYDLEKVKDEKGNETIKKVEAYYSASSEEEINLLKKRMDEGNFTTVYTVTVSIPRAKNFAGIKEICPDEEEAAGNFNRGAKQKANNRLKAKLLETTPEGNFTFNPEADLKNGVLDMTEEIASPSKRKVLTEEEKLDRFLEQFPEATRSLMKQAYLQSRQAPVAA